MKASELADMQQRVTEELRHMDTKYSPASLESRYGPYHQAAAVLSTFDSSTLKPVMVNEASISESIEDVLADSTLVPNKTKQNCWILLPDVRKDVLQQMRSRETMQRALAANPQQLKDSTQEMLEAYIRGNAPQLEQQDLAHITGTFQVGEWLGDVLDGIPSRDRIRQRFEMLTLLQPFEQIAGEHFRGRQKELQILRDYVGVLPPGSFSERVNRIAAAIFNWHEKPPLIIFGPGGRGKSALIARFILEHATLPKTEKFPWAYLDFDRPAILPEDPLTILLEAVRQLGVQYPNARKFCDRLYADWQEQLVKQTSRTRKRSKQQGSDEKIRVVATRRDWELILTDFANLLRNLKVETAPFLLVLDTFETVQYRSSVIVAALFGFLQVFQANVPRLRTVLVGRAPIAETPDWKIQPLELGNFDSEAAQGFLEANHLPLSLARAVAEEVGGNPLSLKLALDLWEIWSKESARADPLELFRFREKLTENEIQGTLFARILERVNDPNVRKLAHPGLVLRRVTADLIQQVLAKPCDVLVKDAADAQRLFDEMRREVSLVTYEDGALRHREDVRRVMVHLMRRNEPDKVRQIEESAAAYYAQQEGSVARAEELYHLLSLKRPVAILDSRWIDNCGLEPYLFSALEELDIREKAWLASRLGVSLSAAERSQADLVSWELDTVQHVRDLLANEQFDQALVSLSERSDWTPGSLLYRFKSEALERKGEWSQARDVIVKGIESASQAGNRQLATDLRIRGASVNLELGNAAAARQMLDEAESLVAGEGEDSLRLIALKLTRLDTYRVIGYVSAETPKMKNELLDLFNKVSDEQVTTEPVLMRRLAFYLAHDHVDLLRRIIRLNGLGTKRQGSLRRLAREFAAWDSQMSAQAEERPGLLARQAGFEPKASLTESWTQFVLQADPQSLGRTVANLLQSNVSSSLISATLDVLLENIVEDNVGNVTQSVGTVSGGDIVGIKIGNISGGVNIGVKTEDTVDAGGQISGVQIDKLGGSNSTAVYVAKSLPRLTQQQKNQFAEALLYAFPTRTSLANMLRIRLDRNLESIALTDNLRSSVIRVIEHFEEIDATAQLLTAARESNPGNVPLLQFAAQFGLAPTAFNESRLEQVSNQSSLMVDPSAWQSRLGELEPRVCRVELTAEDSNMYGTGFLVGPDLVLTAYHVVEPLIQGKIKPEDTRLRFDYKALKGGTTLNPGTLFKLAGDWMVDFSSYGSIAWQGKEADLPTPDELDYALLHLEEAPGAEPIGGERAEVSAAVRGWIEVASTPAKIVQGGPIFILHHPRASPIKLSFDSTGIIGLNSNGTRVQYRVDTEPGSGGAPCFDGDWNLIAIHQGSMSGGRLKSGASNYGTPITAILRLLDIHGKGNLLNTRLA